MGEKIPNLEKTHLSKNKQRLVGIFKPLLQFIGQMIGSGIKTIGSFLIILLLFSFLGGALNGKTVESGREVILSGTGPNKIIVIPLTGIILNQAEPFSQASGTITPEMVRKALHRAEEDTNTKGIVLEIESPGGSAVASDRIYELLDQFQRKTKKPLIALLGDTAASGGYYVASRADKIVANTSTITGSIGVIATNVKLMGLMEKLGIKEEVFKTGEFKDILSSSRETTAKEKEIIDSILANSYEQFLDRVSVGRHIDKEKVRVLATGRIYSGQQAKEVGLVDNLGNLDMAVALVKEHAELSDAQVVRLETGGFFETLFSGITFSWIGRLFAPAPVPRVWYLMQ